MCMIDHASSIYTSILIQCGFSSSTQSLASKNTGSISKKMEITRHVHLHGISVNKSHLCTKLTKLCVSRAIK